MQSKLPFYRQEKPYSCVPACLRMVLAVQGCVVSESELRELCDCTFFGTEALNAVDALRKIGFSNSSKCNIKTTELIVELNAGFYPIVFVNLLPIDSVNNPHAVIVMAIDEDDVTVCDPLQGQRLLPRSTFDTAWAMMRNLAILVRD